MISDFVKGWDYNKSALRKHLETHRQVEYNSYAKLLKRTFELVINPVFKDKEKQFDIDRLTEIDDGEYQGSLVFLIPQDVYQPEPYNYVWTCVDYGSCSGCDTLQGISGYEDGYPTEEQVRDYMSLCLHMLQRCKWLIGEDEYFKQDHNDVE